MIKEDFSKALSLLSSVSEEPIDEILHSKRIFCSRLRYILIVTLWDDGYKATEICPLLGKYQSYATQASRVVSNLSKYGDKRIVDVYRKFLLLYKTDVYKGKLENVCKRYGISPTDDFLEDILSCLR